MGLMIICVTVIICFLTCNEKAPNVEREKTKQIIYQWKLDSLKQHIYEESEFRKNFKEIGEIGEME